WPADKTVFVDFLNPKAHEWWADEVRRFAEKIPFAALWIDMNVQKDGNGDLHSHYDVHSLYGHSQIKPSLQAMEAVTRKRSFVFSRSTFVGSGAYAGHWLGDNSPDWNQLRQSVIGMLEFNIFGIPYVGADICAYFGNTDPQLCLRWMQLGAFYPFSRNHNGKDSWEQDPVAMGPQVTDASKKAFDRRYTLLPYLYTLFGAASMDGGTVVKSLMEVFPTDLTARNIDRQFMWGDALLVTPVLDPDVTSVRGYFPNGDWYDFETGGELVHTASAYQVLPASLDTNIPLHVRGGHIIPMQERAANTRESLKTPYSLLIAPKHYPAVAGVNDDHQDATGSLFWDGGLEIRTSIVQSTDFVATFRYDLIVEDTPGSTTTTRRHGIVRITPALTSTTANTMPGISRITIMGYPEDVPAPTRATVAVVGVPVARQTVTIKYDPTLRVFTLENLELNWNMPIVEVNFWNYAADPQPGARIECLPDERTVTRDRCVERGCSFKKRTAGMDSMVPECYTNADAAGYQLRKVASDLREDHIELFDLTQIHAKPLYSVPFVQPRLMVEPKSETTLRFKFFDAGKERYEVPIPLHTLPTGNLDRALYEVRQVGTRDYGMQIVRKSTGAVLWDMSLGGLYLEDQFLQITTRLPSTYVYGFGDNRHNSLRHKMDWKTWPMFSRDAAPTNPNKEDNLYGVIPFYMCIEEDGSAHGVFLLNSNAMDYRFQPAPAGLTIRSIGGVLDFHVFMGPTPDDVIRQYTELTGRSFMPPYWGLGFQISRWGFRDLAHVKLVVNRTVEAQIPLDAVYGDIDYMLHRQDFTVDPVNFAGLPQYIDELKSNGMRYVIILDPAIHADAKLKYPGTPAENYTAYTEGVKRDIFIKWPASLASRPEFADSVGPNRAMLGKVWPDGRSAFPDFFKNETLQWWTDMIEEQYTVQGITFDALWLDMNEVSSFDTNENASSPNSWYCDKPDALPGNHTCFSLQCPKDDLLENPPYKPMAIRAWITENRPQPLMSDKTLCMRAETSIDGKIFNQYDVHSLYGWSQAEVTYRVAQNIRKERSFVFSRSTFPGAQQYVGHWGGDNAGNYNDLRHSIIYLLEFNMFGFPYMGSDICGFFENTQLDVCMKWSAAGAFYPFARNHNANGNVDQDPAVHPETLDAAKRALNIRYTLLPYLYTLFYRSHVFGDTVSRPLHHVPILSANNTRTFYIPTQNFYDYYDGSLTPAGDHAFTWNEPNLVPLHLRPGFIIPTQAPATNTRDSRKNPYTLLVVADNDHPIAKGELFWDDGKSIDTYQTGNYYLAEFEYDHTQRSFAFNVVHNGLQGDAVAEFAALQLTTIKFYTRNKGAPGVQHVDMIFNGLPALVSVGVVTTPEFIIIQYPLSMTTSFSFSFPAITLVGAPTGASFIDCDPDRSVNAQGCRSKGCIWHEVLGTAQPSCSFSQNPAGVGYIREDQTVPLASFKLTNGVAVPLKANNGASLSRPNYYPKLQLIVQEYGDNILRVLIQGTKLEDPAFAITSVPCVSAPFSCEPARAATNAAYEYELFEDSTRVVSIRVKRKGTTRYLFDSSGGTLVFANQFRELTTRVPSTFVYGLGEHSHNSFRHNFNYKSWGMFARDQPPGGPQNLYGVHPYVQVVEDNEGHTFGTLFLNAHAQEAIFTPTPAITYRSIGGQLDFFLFIGDSPSHVNQLYTGMIGKPFLPPYWALGFQLSRDVFYGDIDFFDGERDFTIGESFKDLPTYVRTKAATGLRFVTILDPCIAAITEGPGSDVFKRGLDKGDVYIQWPTTYVDVNNQSYSTIDSNQPPYLLGHVWPADKTVFVDFLNPKAHEWWADEVRRFAEKIPFAALWIDMNEPANFGTNNYDVWYGGFSAVYPWSLQCPNGTDDFLENPPYIPRSLDTPSGRLSDKTICMSAVQKDGNGDLHSHYDVHSLYGHSQIKPSLQAMEAVTRKRSFVFSRSTFVGSGAYAGHWLGDNSPDWNQLRQSVIGMLEFNIFGIPYVGADICAYFGNTDPQLCLRWMQLGAFYPFSRNHNGKDSWEQDPVAMGPQVTDASKKAFDRRYTLLPYLYTLFGAASMDGGTVVKSLMEVFPTDLTARNIDRQFMWGDALLVTPVLEPDVSTVKGYFPDGDWYDFETGVELVHTASAHQVLPVSLDDNIPLHVRGGHIIPMQERGANTLESSKTPYSLLVAPKHYPAVAGVNDDHQAAAGSLFWDGGLEIRTSTNQPNDFVASFRYNLMVEDTPGNLHGIVSISSPKVPTTTNEMPGLDRITIMGYPENVLPPNRAIVTVLGVPVSPQTVTVSYDLTRRVLTLENLKLNWNVSVVEVNFWNYAAATN
ncbi:Sucrase-isomaltase, intestinal, partial [Hypsibius exemplaris]